MKLSKSLSMVLLALAGFALIVGCASASLPTLLFLPGESTEVTGQGAVNGPIKTVVFEAEIGEEIVGTGVVVMLGPAGNRSHLGKYIIELKGMSFEGKKCNNLGATKESGIVLVTGDEFHFVYVGLGTRLAVGLLLLVSRFEAECGSLKVALEGLLLSRVTKIAASDIEVIGFVLGCTKPGKAELPTFENEKGETVKALLKLDLGLGFETGCLRAPEVTLLLSHMITIDL